MDSSSPFKSNERPNIRHSAFASEFAWVGKNRFFISTFCFSPHHPFHLRGWHCCSWQIWCFAFLPLGYRADRDSVGGGQESRPWHAPGQSNQSFFLVLFQMEYTSQAPEILASFPFSSSAAWVEEKDARRASSSSAARLLSRFHRHRTSRYAQRYPSAST